MSVHYLLKGMLLGLSIAAPVGPIGLLCIRRSIAEGCRVGFISGLGAATADAVYAAIGGFALTTLTQWLIRARVGLSLGGGLFLVYLGVRTFRARAAGDVASAHNSSSAVRAGREAYVSTLLLTLANPMTIVSFAGVFAGLGTPHGAGAETRYTATGLLVTGTFGGSALWWLLLSGVAGRARRHIDASALRLINLACGATLASFGLYAIATSLR
jgi:threonine/homoserine/homoserine lactone efflux protein